MSRNTMRGGVYGLVQIRVTKVHGRTLLALRVVGWVSNFQKIAIS